MSSVQITNHVELMRSRFLEQFKGSVVFDAVVESIGNQIQAAENMFNQLLVDRAVSSAVGAQLDEIGELVGKNRGGRSDTDYRGAIRLKIYVNSSEGTPENIIQAVAFTTESEYVALSEVYPAAIIVTFNGQLPDNLTDTINSTSAAGVFLVTLISGFGTPANELLTFVEHDAAGNVAWTNPNGNTQIGFDYGYELNVQSGNRLIYSTGDAAFVTRYDIDAVGRGGKMGEGINIG